MAVIGLCGGEVELSGVRTVSLNVFHLGAGDGSCGCWFFRVCVFVCFGWLGCLLAFVWFWFFDRAPSPPSYISYEVASHSEMGT